MLKENKFILKIWKGNQEGTVIVSIPKQVATQYKLDVTSHVILEKHLEGILLRKLVI